jgi:GAF domain-containing protein
MLESERAFGECEMTRDGEEFVLRVELQPLSNIRHLPGAMLMILRDITTARVRRDLHERSRELLALSAISADIASTLELDQVIARAVQQVYNLTHAGASMVYLVDERDPSVLHQADNLISEEGIIAPSNRFTIDFIIRRGPVSHVAQTRQTLIVSNANLETYGQWLKDFGLQAGTLIPLIARERMIGLLMVAYSAPHTFTPIEIALLESVARQLAVAIDNARLHDQERRQRRIAEVLREAASALGTKRQAEGLQALLALLGEILAYDRATVLLVAEPGKLRVGAHAGFERLADSDTITNSSVDIEDYPYLKRLFEDRAPQLVADTTTDSLWKPGPYGYNSWIGAPLIIYDQVLGCLSLAHHQPGHFTDDDLRIASAFAAQAAIAAENTRLFDAISRQNRALSALNTVLAASNEALIHEDLPLVLLERVLEALGLSEGVIHYYDDVARELRLRAAAGLPDAVTDRLQRLPVITPLAGVVLPPVADGQVYEFFSAPLISHGVGIGLLSIRQKTDSPISDDLKQLLINIGQQVGVVMDNAALFEDTSRRAALSTDLGRLEPGDWRAA